MRQQGQDIVAAAMQRRVEPQPSPVPAVCKSSSMNFEQNDMGLLAESPSINLGNKTLKRRNSTSDLVNLMMDEKAKKKIKIDENKEGMDAYKDMKLKLEQEKLELMRAAQLNSDKRLEATHQVEMEKIRLQELKEERKKMEEERMMKKDEAMIESVKKQNEMMYEILKLMMQKENK